MAATCCCRWGAARSGEYPEFGCAHCDVHLGGLGETEKCRRHRRIERELAPYRENREGLNDGQ